MSITGVAEVQDINNDKQHNNTNNKGLMEDTPQGTKEDEEEEENEIADNISI